jgi:hypothetical protein
MALTFAALALVSWFTAALVITCTEKRSWIRPLAGLIMACLCYLEFLACFDFSNSLIYNGVAAGGACIQFLHHVNILWINGIDLCDLDPNADTTSILAALQNLPSALSLAWNPRGIGTRWKTKNLPD